jgi:SAM-dependent methyltransferase
MFTSPRPSPAAISSYYPRDYQPFHAPHLPSDRQTVTSALKRVVRRLLDPKEHVLPRGIVPGRALEVGCGSGRQLTELAAAGWKVEGLEPSAETAARLRKESKFPVTTGTIEETSFEKKSFDLIVALMVLEHLHDPLECLSRIHSWLRPGGFLTGSVPNAASWEFRFFKEKWFALQVPTHLFHFTPRTLEQTLVASGFCNVEIYQQRNVNNLMVHLGWLLSRRQLPGAKTCLSYPERGSWLLRYSLRPAASVLAWMQQAGRITFIAQRSGGDRPLDDRSLALTDLAKRAKRGGRFMDTERQLNHV